MTRNHLHLFSKNRWTHLRSWRRSVVVLAVVFAVLLFGTMINAIRRSKEPHKGQRGDGGSKVHLSSDSSPPPSVFHLDLMDELPFVFQDPSGCSDMNSLLEFLEKEILRITPEEHFLYTDADRSRSVLQSLYLEQRNWELRTNVLTPCEQPTGAHGDFDYVPSKLTPGLMGIDYLHTFAASLEYAKYAELNEKFVELEPNPTVIYHIISNFLLSFNSSVEPNMNTPHPNASGPTGVPLVPVILSTDRKTNENHLYKNLPLDGSKGPIDASMQHPDGHPMVWHYNFPQSERSRIYPLYSKLMPWALPLTRELLQPFNSIVNSQKQPQMHAILNVMANSPSIRIWLPDSSDINKQHYKLSLNSTYATANMSDICRQHPSSLPQV
eukprot:gene1603-980_t